VISTSPRYNPANDFYYSTGNLACLKLLACKCSQSCNQVGGKGVICYKLYTLYTPYTLNILYTHYTLYSMNLLKPIFSLENKIQAALLGGIGGVDVKDVTDELANLKNEPCVIYTYGLSPFSTEAISVLEAAGAKFEKRELGLEWFLLGPQASVMRLELENLTGQSSLPHVFIGGESIGGLSTGTPGLAALVESGELATKLKKAKAL
jgi:glutaredoxin-related protein